jgi:hypothetical protein
MILLHSPLVGSLAWQPPADACVDVATTRRGSALSPAFDEGPSYYEARLLGGRCSAGRGRRTTGTTALPKPGLPNLPFGLISFPTTSRRRRRGAGLLGAGPITAARPLSMMLWHS